MNKKQLRDYFAGQALAGIMADPTTNEEYTTPEDWDGWADDRADCCYCLADAMLKRREQ